MNSLDPDPNLPSPHASEFRKGWPVLLVAGIAVGSGATLPLYSLSLFVAPLEAEFGWARTSVLQASAFLTAALFLMTPAAGWLIDRTEVRRVAVPSAMLMGALLLALSQIRDQITIFYAGFALLGIVGVGTTAVGYSRITAAWFAKNRGLALGIMLSGMNVSVAIAPIAMELSIRHLGWRGAFVILAAWILSVAPAVWIFLREPRQTARTDGLSVQKASIAGLTRSQALRTRQFWLIATSAFLMAVPISALIAHAIPFMEDRGLSRTDAAQLAALIGVGGLFGRIGAGALVDRFYPPAIAALILAAAAGGCVLLARTDALALGILLIGICLGSEGDLLAFFTGRYFGLKTFSELFGWFYAAFSVGFTIGPLAASTLYELNGGYDQAFFVFAGIFLFAAVLQAMLGRPANPATNPA